ncbi:MAG: NADH-quinone oxidoreductase subunit A [Candidatus Omnitrophica bacterium]|nr:NADH-quinone oxidoreductase subunit A [Candidatus Omnitrophota bacterium]
MDSYYSSYLFIAVFFCVALVFPVLPLILAKFIAPKKPSPIKQATYECGVEATGDAWAQIRVQYYIFALIFVIFDIEAVFVFPWAVAYRQLGLFAFVEMMIFLGILIGGWAYAWKKGALEWD